MDFIDAESYKADLEKVLENYKFPVDTIVFVDGFENDPHAVIRTFKISRKIHMKRKMTYEEAAAKMEYSFSKFPEEQELIKSEPDFLFLIMIKELYHLTYKYQNDYECAKWAFYDIKKSKTSGKPLPEPHRAHDYNKDPQG